MNIHDKIRANATIAAVRRYREQSHLRGFWLGVHAADGVLQHLTAQRGW